MKIKKTLLILAVVVIAVALCVTAYAVLDLDETKEKEENGSAETEVVRKLQQIEFTGDVYPDAVKSRKITVGGKELTVNYKYSETSDYFEAYEGTRSDVYYDSDNNIYRFDTEGNLCTKIEADDGILRKDTDSIREPLAESDYLRIAEEYMREVFGSDVDGYKYYRHYDRDSSGRYSVDFAKFVGEDDFAMVDICSVFVSADGEGIMCSKSPKNTLEGFDMSLLDGVTREDVMAFAEEEAKRVFGDYGIIELETSATIGLGCNESGYYLSISYDLVTEKVVPCELTELYEMDIAKSADEHRYGVSFAYELGA